MASWPSLKRQRRARIEIVIPARRRLIPGTAPSQPPMSLLPEHDSDAFIVNKIIHPTTPMLDRGATRRLCYIVGWPNLPAARIVVPCTRIYDYASPRVVEEWEYQDSLRREEDEWEGAIEEAKLASLSEPLPKKRGRHPKARVMIEIPPTPVLGKEDQKLIARKKAAGPSLSTPQKRQLDEFLEDERDSGEDKDQEDRGDSETVIYRQLFGQPTQEDVDTDMGEQVPPVKSTEDEDMGDGMHMGRDFRSSSVVPMSRLPAASHPSKGVTGIHRNTKKPTALKPKPNVSLSFGRLLQPTVNAGTDQSPNQSSSARSSPAWSISSVHHIPPTRATFVTSKASATAPSMSEATQKGRSRTSMPIRASRAKEDHGHGTTRQSPMPTSAFTPVPSASQRNSSIAPAHGPLISTLQQQPLPGTETPSTAKPPKKKRKIADQEGPEQDLDYEVKRLEGDQMRDENGVPVRYFKVRWKGDWPPGQNPTWEPEKNITRSLVTRYLKKKAAKEGAISETPRKPAQQTLSPWLNKRYTSVTDAFEDGNEAVSLAAEEPSRGQKERDEDDDEVEQLRVTENDEIPDSQSEHSKGRFDWGLARHFDPLRSTGGVE